MEDLLARFLDGEIEDREAALLLRVAEDDPRIERELREYESMLAAAERLPLQRPSHGFTERVMRSIERPAEVRGRARPGSGLRRWYAPAAALILGVLLGYLGGARLPSGPVERPTSGSAYPAQFPVQVSQPALGAANLRAVRLSYAGSRPGLRSVSVAGSFNGWDQQAAPMTREDGSWTILLLLPPGDYEYMFVEDGLSWVTDPRAPGRRQDGFGGENGLLAVEG